MLYNRPENPSNSAKKKAIRPTSFKVIQGHRGRYQSKARMRFPISDSYLVPFRSYRSLLFTFWTLRFRATLCGAWGQRIRCWAH